VAQEEAKRRRYPAVAVVKPEPGASVIDLTDEFRAPAPRVARDVSRSPRMGPHVKIEPHLNIKPEPHVKIEPGESVVDLSGERMGGPHVVALPSHVPRAVLEAALRAMGENPVWRECGVRFESGREEPSHLQLRLGLQKRAIVNYYPSTSRMHVNGKWNPALVAALSAALDAAARRNSLGA